MASLHHIALGARDVEAVAAFYREAFALPERRRHFDDEGLRSIWLSLGDALLMIERTQMQAAPVQQIGVGPFLLAFRVSPEQREELEAHLESMGAPIEDRTEHTSYARDPEQNRVAISHYPSDVD